MRDQWWRDLAKKYLEGEEADADSGPGPVGYKPISPDADKAIPEPYKEYPWSPKAKNSYPVDVPDMPRFGHQSFPFRGPILKTIPWLRSEERVNKNPNATQRFVDRLEAAYAAPEVPEAENKAPPKNPAQKDAPVEDPYLPPPAEEGKFFPQLLAKIKQAFPALKQTFTEPPTYIWNPKEGPTDKLDVKKLKDLIKMKVPGLMWESTPQSAESATVKFADGTYAEISIGSQDADHLTVTYHLD